jgi:hypothetical protein
LSSHWLEFLSTSVASVLLERCSTSRWFNSRVGGRIHKAGAPLYLTRKNRRVGLRPARREDHKTLEVHTLGNRHTRSASPTTGLRSVCSTSCYAPAAGMALIRQRLGLMPGQPAIVLGDGGSFEPFVMQIGGGRPQRRKRSIRRNCIGMRFLRILRFLRWDIRPAMGGCVFSERG